MSGLRLIGVVFLGFSMPLGFEGFGSNNLILKVLSVSLFSLGMLCILSDVFHWYEWVQIVLGVPPEKRWRKSE